MSIKLGHYSVSNFMVEFDGVAAGYLTSFQPPSAEVEVSEAHQGPDVVNKKMLGQYKIGEATAVFNISQASGFLDWAQTFWKKQCVEKDITVVLADQDYNAKRGINMNACLITGVELPPLKASDGKKVLDMTVKFQPQNIKYMPGGGKVQGTLGKKAKNWFTNNFRVTEVFGLKTEWITSIDLPKISAKLSKEFHGSAALPLINVASNDFGPVKIEIGPAGAEGAQALAQQTMLEGISGEGHFQDIIIEVLDQSLKTTLGTFTLKGCGLKKYDWSPKLEGGKEGGATSTLEFVVEEFEFNIAHK